MCYPFLRVTRRIIYFFCLITISLAAKAQPLPDLIPYLEGSKWGYCDSNGVVKIKPQWNLADPFCGDKAAVAFYEPKHQIYTYSLINRSGEYLIPPSRNWDRNWNGWEKTNLNVHDDQGRYGLIDTENRLLLPFAYDRPLYPPDFLSRSYRPVSVDNKWGVVSNKGEILVPFRYEKVEELRGADTTSPAFKAYEKGMWQLIDFHGNPVLKDPYTSIFPDLFFNAPDHVRKGFILEQQRLIVPGDSSKGFEFLYGWVDYPAGKFIRPQYHSFHFVSDKLYSTEKGLFYENGKRALPEKYFDFYRINDTLFCSSREKISRDSVKNSRHALDIQTLKPLREAATSRTGNFPGGPELRSGCGTGAMLARLAQEREARRAAVIIGGLQTRTFVRDSIVWLTGFYIGKGQIAASGYHLRTQIAWQVVMDDTARFLFPPVRNGKSITALNLHDGLLVFKASSGREHPDYEVGTLDGAILVSSYSKIITRAFRDQNGRLLIIAADPGSEETTRSWYGDDMSGDEPSSTRVNAKICDKSLIPLPALKHYFFRSFVNNDLHQVEYYNGLMQVTDTAGHAGFIDLEGAVSVKGVSFKYRDFTVCTPDVFLVEDTATHGQKLIGRNDINLVPGVTIKGVHPLKESQQQHYELFYPPAKTLPLLQVYFESELNKWNYPFVFMSESGKLFGTNL